MKYHNKGILDYSLVRIFISVGQDGLIDYCK